MNAITPVAGRTHADAAAAILRQALAASHAPLRDAVASYRSACAGLAAGADLLDVLRGAGDIVLAAEAIVAASRQAEAAARAALANAMAETGCPAVALASHTVHLSTKPTRVDIEDESAIAHTASTPDKVAIAKLLRAGGEVPGARLLGNHESLVVLKERTS